VRPNAAGISAGVAADRVPVLARWEADRPVRVAVLVGGRGDRLACLVASLGSPGEQGAHRCADGELPVGQLLTGVELVDRVERLDRHLGEAGVGQRGAQHGGVAQAEEPRLAGRCSGRGWQRLRREIAPTTVLTSG
jgi:hypothetical protein